MFDRKAHWQNVYQEKSPLDVSWYQKEPKLSLELIHRTGVSLDETIIDVGGGASVLVDFLCKDGFTNLSVLDISENALAGAKNRLGDLAKNIEWVESDVTEFNSSHKLTLWHEWIRHCFLHVKIWQRCDGMSRKESTHHLVVAMNALRSPREADPD